MGWGGGGGARNNDTRITLYSMHVCLCTCWFIVRSTCTTSAATVDTTLILSFDGMSRHVWIIIKQGFVP